jgi:hypothetical protein
MMHSNSFVLAVKDSNGRILRELGGRVYLPFGSEYSLFLKNMHDVRACCAITIDGTDILGGQELIIPASGNLDLERFLADGNMNKGKKFRLVEKSDSRVQDPSNPENGIVEVSFWKELKPIIYYADPIPTPWIAPMPFKYPYDPFYKTTCNLMSSSTPNIGAKTSFSANCCADMSASNAATIEGSASRQAFSTTYFAGKDGAATVLRLTMVGCNKPITVNETKHIFCGRCGKRNSFRMTYCGKCGLKLDKEELINA